MLSTDGSIFRKRPGLRGLPADNPGRGRNGGVCRAKELSVHPRGAGSGLCGASLGSGIVVDFTRYMNRLVEIDLANNTFTCEPGYRFGELEAALAGRGLFFPPDPSSGEYATFGGMFGHQCQRRPLGQIRQCVRLFRRRRSGAEQRPGDPPGRGHRAPPSTTCPRISGSFITSMPTTPTPSKAPIPRCAATARATISGGW